MSQDVNKTLQELESVNSNFAKKPNMLTAIKNAITTLREVEANKFDPAGAAKAQKTLEMLQRTDDLSVETIQSEVNDIMAYLTTGLNNLVAQLTARLGEYNDVKSSIVELRKELAEVYKVEKEYQNLVATINAHEQIKADFDATHGKAVADAEARVAELQAQMDNLESELAAKRKEAEDKLRADIKREKDEHTYNFGRDKIRQHDELEDELKAKRAKHDESVKAQIDELDKREAELSTKAADLGQREGILKSGQSKLEKDRADFEEKFEARVTAEVDRRVELVTARKDAELGVERAQREAAEGRVTALEAQVASLQAQLNEAHANVQKVAMAAVDGAHAKTALDRVSDMATKTVGNK